MKQHFSLDPGLVHLNHAAVAPWPNVCRDAIEHFARENANRGSEDYPSWLKIEQQLRERLGLLIGCDDPSRIALVKNTSEALSFIAYGLSWSAGDSIVIPSCEFPSNRIVWESLALKGVEVRAVDIRAADPDDAETRLINACDESTRLLCTSSVQYADGFRMNLEHLGKFCKENGVLFAVDAIQSLGALPFDVEAVGADFVATDGHKWMLGPEGLGLFYVRDSVQDKLQLTEYGWHMVESPSDFDQGPWQPAATARRFECGSPNMLAAHGLNASLGLLHQIGMEAVSSLVLNNGKLLIEAVEDEPLFSLASSSCTERRSGIVSFNAPGVPAERIYRELMGRRVLCACRGGNIRFSSHFHTTKDELLRGIEHTKEIVFNMKKVS